jgi:hypothetical protein
MKFTTEHYNILKNRVADLGIDKLKQAKAEYKEKGLSETRFLFDVFYASKTKIGDGIGLSSNCGIEGDYNDNHIETAMKKVISELTA